MLHPDLSTHRAKATQGQSACSFKTDCGARDEDILQHSAEGFPVSPEGPPQPRWLPPQESAGKNLYLRSHASLGWTNWHEVACER